MLYKPTLDITSFSVPMQLTWNINTEVYIKDEGKVKLVQYITERLDLNLLPTLYPRYGRKPALHPLNMLQILLLAYSEGCFSSRQIENRCRYDLRFIYLLSHQSPPDHSTIARFKRRLEPFIEAILAKFVDLLCDYKLIDLSSLYIDGTKIESVANKYTFVWKKSVQKHQKKLIHKIVQELNIPIDSTTGEVLKYLKKAFNHSKNECKKNHIKFVDGKGKRKTKLQKQYEIYKDWLNRLEVYQHHLKCMGERNSYSKTDIDATFMRMKDDHMRNGQLKPAYNIQYGSSCYFIIGSYISHHPSDMHTLPLFVEKLSCLYPNKLDKIVADAGYESEENYAYLKSKRLRAFIKPSNYEVAKTRKYKKSQEERKQFVYDAKTDSYYHPNGKVFIRVSNRKQKTASGYVRESKVYRCFDWSESQKTRSIYITEKFDKYRQESLDNITSKEGIIERMNRSIQAEGVFSKMKTGLGYQRFKSKGLKNIRLEISLIALAINLNTLQSKIKRKEFEAKKYYPKELA